MNIETLEYIRIQLMGHSVIFALDTLVFFILVALSFPLKKQMSWDVYKIVGTDVSHISMLSIVNNRNVAHLPAIRSSSKDFNSGGSTNSSGSHYPLPI